MSESWTAVVVAAISALAVIAGVWSRDILARGKTEVHERVVWLRERQLETCGEALSSARKVRAGFERAYEDWRKAGSRVNGYAAVDIVEEPLTDFLRVADVASLLPGLPQAELAALRESVRQLAAVTRWQRYERDRAAARKAFDSAIDQFASKVRAALDA